MTDGGTVTDGPAAELSAEERERFRRRRRQRLPSRWLPLAWFAFAHLCLAAAFALVAADPAAFAGFYYHPKMVAVVHLVTLGWITGSILGALYVIAPTALGVPLPAAAADAWGAGLTMIGTLGMVSHFWLDSPSGLVWSAAAAITGLATVGGRFLTALRQASVPPEVALHFRLAFFNLYAAATLGLLTGLDRTASVLSGHVLAHVYAHAHLAALGWATMMVMAAGYRLFPMLLPAAMPTGPVVRTGAVLFEAGVLGLAASLYLGGGGRLREVLPAWAAPAWATPVAALAVVAGLGIFLSRVRWMTRNRRPPPKTLPKPDFGVWQAMTALGWMAVACGAGLVLALAPPAAWKVELATLYGVAGLVGFLSQVVVGVQIRLLPTWAWLWAAAEGTFRGGRPESPWEMPSRPLQVAVLAAWGVGVPALAAGLAAGLPPLARAGAAALLAAVLVGAANAWRVARHALPR